ncbi:MAG: TIGR03086 family protein, partial [Actinomycetota bacterium]|nr:TIGR03086 family protein [Actinomycetota bacterium]
WQASADRLTAAFAAAESGRRVLLVELSDTIRFSVPRAIGFQLLDTLVHTWDVATALGESFHPDEHLVEATLALAAQVPEGPARDLPNSQFAPALAPNGADPWDHVLALLGRRSPTSTMP